MMLHELMLQVWNSVKDSGTTAEDPNLSDKLISGLRDALKKQHEDDIQNQKDLDAELKEQKKHITSEDVRDGFVASVSAIDTMIQDLSDPLPEYLS